MSGDELYKTWETMRARCYREKNPSFKRYGGRGIKVCERWNSFENFHADMHPRPEGAQLDRIDSNGDYSKENCRWVTPLENVLNRSVTVFIEYQGERLSLTEAARRSGISRRTIRRRMHQGLDPFE